MARAGTINSSFNNVGNPISDFDFGAERAAALIGGLGLAAFGIRQRSLTGAVLASAGGYLIYSGITSPTPLTDAARRTAVPVVAQKTFTIDKPAAEIFQFLRTPENYPRIMENIDSVVSISQNRTQWKTKSRFGKRYEWESQITEVRENELIAWQTVPGSEIDSVGSIRLSPAPAGRGTEVRLHITYKPPLGKVGQAFALMFGEDAEQQIRESLRHLKQVLETGEIPTIKGQPHGKRSAADKALQKLLGEHAA
jgi:uncharacterized membrane protein